MGPTCSHVGPALGCKDLGESNFHWDDGPPSSEVEQPEFSSSKKQRTEDFAFNLYWELIFFDNSHYKLVLNLIIQYRKTGI